MIKWHGMPPDLAPAPGPPDKPYRVTRYREIRARQIGPTFEAFFRWYWQANAVSFIWHHLFGYSCNTWKRNAGTEPARLEEPSTRGIETFKLNGPEDTTMK